MQPLNEARKALELSLGDDLKKQYFVLLKQWFSFKASLTKYQFNCSVRKLLLNEEQLRHHNAFILAIYTKVNSTRAKNVRSASDKGSFELSDYGEYVSPSSPKLPTADFEGRSAASELFVPDCGFMATRVALHVWDNNLEGAQENVAEFMVNACQIFVKNIITAMISRKQGYKIRDGKFQYGFGLPVPDPFIRNTNNIIDHTLESKVEVSSNDDSFIPSCRASLENVEQQVAFSYSCGKRKRSDDTLSVKLLYDTLREDPSIIGMDSIQAISLFKLSLQLES